MSKKQKPIELLLELAALEGREAKLENLVLKADRDSNIVCSEDVEQAIEAFTKSEKSSLGYAAAGFVPVLLLFNTLPFLRGINDFFLDVLVALAAIILGFAGIYFALYKALFLGPRRIFMEGYRIGLVHKYSFFIFPRGWWKMINLAAIYCIPFGYLFIVIIMLRVLFL